MICEIKYNFSTTALHHFTDEETEPGEGKKLLQGSHQEPLGEESCEPRSPSL